MRRFVFVWSIVGMVVAATASSVAEQPPQNCATSFVIDSKGVLDENAVALAKCQAGGTVIAAVCSYDATNPHTVEIISKMFFKNNGSTHVILKASIKVTVPAVTDGTPSCAAMPQQIFTSDSFGNGNGKKPYGLYSYLILKDGTLAADPDLDVAQPSSIEDRNVSSRGRGRGRGAAPRR